MFTSHSKINDNEYCAFVLTGLAVEGIRCHFCQSETGNEKCNANVAECTNKAHDGCFTTVERLETGKLFTKVSTNGSLIVERLETGKLFTKVSTNGSSPSRKTGNWHTIY